MEDPNLRHYGTYDDHHTPHARCGAEEGIITFGRDRVNCPFCLLLMNADAESEELPKTLLGFPVVAEQFPTVGGALPFHQHLMNVGGTRFCDMSPELAKTYYVTADEIAKIDCYRCLAIVTWPTK